MANRKNSRRSRRSSSGVRRAPSAQRPADSAGPNSAVPVPFTPRRPYYYDSDSAPSAPPLELMDSVTGYETISFDAVNIPPPKDAHPRPTGPPQSFRPYRLDGPYVTEKQARALLLAFSKKHCCYRNAVAKDMAVTFMDFSTAFLYQLQTFTEKRETAWKYCAFAGGEIDGADNGPAPLPWSIEFSPTEMFVNEVKTLQVPHTSSVKQCHRCHGSGKLPCNECSGKGWIRCMSCHGSAYNTDSAGNRERCFYCYTATHGRGRQDCYKCDSSGKIDCLTCDSHGQILCYIQLTVTWKVNTAEHIVERVSMPEELLRVATGETAYNVEADSLVPLANFPDETINMASVQLLNEHKDIFKDQRILMQRHYVRIIPVSSIRYEWKAHMGDFYIYGKEQKVYAPDYPRACCCACTIV